MKKFFVRVRDWIKNYGYAYKVTAIVVAVVLVIVIYLIVHYATMVTPDYVVVMTTQENNLIASQRTALKTCLEEYGEDLNGDGKVVVELAYSTLFGNENNANAYGAERARLSVAMNEDRWGVVAFDPGAYQYMVQVALLPMGIYQDVSGKFTVWNWKDSQLYQDVNAISETDVDLYFAVRQAPEGVSEKVKQAVKNGNALLERVISGSKINPIDKPE